MPSLAGTGNTTTEIRDAKAIITMVVTSTMVGTNMTVNVTAGTGTTSCIIAASGIGTVSDTGTCPYRILDPDV